MQKTVSKFRAFRESERANRRYYLGLTPRQRLDILLEVIAQHQEADSEPARGLARVVELLNANGVRYVIVGGYAVAYHGHPRYTGDIDIFIEASEANSAGMMKVIDQFGFAGLGLSAEDFRSPDRIVQLGMPPNRIDLITSLDAEAWQTREQATLGNAPVAFLCKELLIRNKRAAGRPQDVADISALTSPDE